MSTCGQLMRSISSSMGRDVECGFLQSRQIQCCCTTQPERVSATGAQSACGTGNSFTAENQESSTLKRASNFSNSFTACRAETVDRISSSQTMLAIITRGFIRIGVGITRIIFDWISSRHTARNSTPLNASGSSRDASACTTDTFRSWDWSSIRSSPRSMLGEKVMTNCANYAQSVKASCIEGAVAEVEMIA